MDRDRSGERSRARRRRGGDHCYSQRLGLGYRLRRSDLGGRGGNPESPDWQRDRPDPVGASPNAVAARDGSTWTTNGDARSVSRINAYKRDDREHHRRQPTDGIACGDGFIWVANGLDGTVTKIDPQIDQPVDTIDVGNGPAGVAVGLGYVWVANSNDGTLSGSTCAPTGRFRRSRSARAQTGSPSASTRSG